MRVNEGQEKMVEEILESIVVDPKVMVGKPVIRGTRIPVELIVSLLAKGQSVEDILEDYPQLTRSDVTAALQYAARILGNEEVFPLIAGEA